MMTDYILSPCSLAARGLSQLMLNAARRPVELPVEGVSLRELAAVKRIVVYLPDDPLWMLTTLRQAARLLDEALPPLPMLILSRSPAIWLWQTLLYQVSHPDRLRNVHTAPADDAPRDKCVHFREINGIAAAFQYLQKNYNPTAAFSL